jgi:hypothetical protein
VIFVLFALCCFVNGRSAVKIGRYGNDNVVIIITIIIIQKWVTCVEEIACVRRVRKRHKSLIRKPHGEAQIGQLNDRKIYSGRGEFR